MSRGHRHGGKSQSSKKNVDLIAGNKFVSQKVRKILEQIGFPTKIIEDLNDMVSLNYESGRMLPFEALVVGLAMKYKDAIHHTIYEIPGGDRQDFKDFYKALPDFSSNFFKDASLESPAGVEKLKELMGAMRIDCPCCIAEKEGEGVLTSGYVFDIVNAGVDSEKWDMTADFISTKEARYFLLFCLVTHLLDMYKAMKVTMMEMEKAKNEKNGKGEAVVETSKKER